MLTARSRPPTSRTSPTPSARSRSTLTVLSAISVSSRRLRLPETARVRTGAWSLSSLETVGGRMSSGQEADRVQDLVADVLGGHVHGPAEREGDRHVARAGARERAELRDALDGVDRLLDLLRDLRLHLLDGGAGQLGADADRGQLDGGEAVDAQPEVARAAHDDEREHDHRREHRPADADLGELLHLEVPYFSTVTAWPPVRLPGGIDDRLPRLHARDDLDPVAEPAAGGDAQLLALAVADREHLLHAGEGDERRRRHRHDAVVRLDDHLGLGERAGTEAAGRVGDLRLDEQRPVLLGDRRGQARHHARV